MLDTINLASHISFALESLDVFCFKQFETTFKYMSKLQQYLKTIKENVLSRLMSKFAHV